MNKEEKITISVNEEDVQNIINAYEKDVEYIKQLEKENKQLKDNWNKLKEEIQILLNRQCAIDKFAEEQGLLTYNPVKLNIEYIRNKMQELEQER